MTAKLPIVSNAFWRAHRKLDAVSLMLMVAREYGPFVKLTRQAQQYLVADPMAVEQILISERGQYAKGQFVFNRLGRLLGEGLLSNLSPTWVENRKLIHTVFTKPYLQRYVSQTIELTHSFLDQVEETLKSEKKIEIGGAFMQLEAMIVAKYFFSDDMSLEIARRITAATTDAQHGVLYRFPLTPWLPTPTYLRFRRGVACIEDYAKRLLKRRKSLPEQPDDLIGLLLSEGCSDEMIIDEIKTALIAGHETSGTALTWAIYLLCRHQQYWHALKAEVGSESVTLDSLSAFPLVRAVYDEALRLFPPIWAFPREAIQRSEINGHAIPAGAQFVITPYAVHRLSQYWTHPDGFLPERFLPENKKTILKNAYIPYGTGPHVCIARQLTGQTLPLILAMIVQRFNWQFAESLPKTMPKSLYISMRPAIPIYLQNA